MAMRVAIGNFGNFLFRASLPGYDVLSAPEQGLSIYEGMQPMTPKESGIIGLPGGSFTSQGIANAGLSLPWAYPPFVIIKSVEGYIPGKRTFFALFVAGSSPRIEFHNCMGAAITVKWFAFDEMNF